MDKRKKGFYVFCGGALVGLIAAGLFGYFTYPEDPTFEGGGGFHQLGMLIVYPVVSIFFGITFYIYYRSKQAKKSKDA